MCLALATAGAAMAHNAVENVKADPVITNNVTASAAVGVSLPATPSRLIAEDRVLASAYYDTLGILTVNNRCSEFFGGPETSVAAFSKLIGRVRKDHRAPAVGMEMSGSWENFFNAQTRKEYRLFDKVALNTNGPFYRGKAATAGPTPHRVGSVESNTREARVLMFLHELGHMIKGPEGKWLLPNDGDNEELSHRNTVMIEKVCEDELLGLGGSQAGKELAKRVKAEEELAIPQSASSPEL
jgi:hypothetical protein